MNEKFKNSKEVKSIFKALTKSIEIDRQAPPVRPFTIQLTENHSTHF